MRETETPHGTQLRNLLLFGTVDNPQIVIPENSRSQNVVPATNVDSLPPPMDAVPRRSDRRPYAIFHVRQDQFAIPKPVGTTQASPEEQVFPPPDDVVDKPSINITATGILLVSDLGLDGSEQSTTRLDRQFQRLEQFRRLTETADKWARDLDGLSANQQESTRRILDKFRHIANSWYINELSKEPLTRQTAKDIIQGRLPEAGAVLEEIEKLIRENSINLTDIFDEVDRILHPSLQKEISPETPKLISEAKERERQQNPDAAKEARNKLEETGKEIIQNYKNQAKSTGTEYDPSLDEPDANAAAYFEELWNRVF